VFQETMSLVKHLIFSVANRKIIPSVFVQLSREFYGGISASTKLFSSAA